MTETRVPAGVPTGGQFAASARPEADVRLAEPVTLTLTNMEGKFPMSVEVDAADPLSFTRPGYLAKDTQRPDLVNRLAEQVRDTGSDVWGQPHALVEHHTATYALIGNPVLDDSLRADLIKIHTEHTTDVGSGLPSRLAQQVHAVKDDLGPESIDALSQSPDRDVLWTLAQRNDLTDEQIERLCDRPDAFHLRRQVQDEVARNADGTYNPRIAATMRAALHHRAEA